MGYAIAIGLMLLYLAQIVLVPMVANSKGKDTGVWFLLTLVWILCVGWFAMLGPFAFVVLTGVEGFYGPEIPGLLLVVGVCTVFALLPLLAVLMSRGKKRDDYYSRRARRRGRIR